MEVHQANELNSTTKDPVRGEVRRLVEIVCGPAELVIPGGHLVKKGVNQVYMYESDVEKCRALSCDQEVIDRLKADYETSRVRFLAQQKANERDPKRAESLTWEDVRDDFPGAPNVSAHVRQSAPFHGDPVPPLRGVRYVNDTSYPPPKGEKEASTELQMRFMADAVREALSPIAPQQDALAKIMDRLNALEQQNAELREELAESVKPKRPGRKN